MPKEIITNGAYRRGEPWLQVGWSRGTLVQIGVLTESRQQQSEGGAQIDLTTGEALFCDLDRDGINKMIRALRKARDQAYGSDA